MYSLFHRGIRALCQERDAIVTGTATGPTERVQAESSGVSGARGEGKKERVACVGARASREGIRREDARMAQPFEQVLESLRAVASGKLNQLEERSRAYLSEIGATIEARVESEKSRAARTGGRRAAAASSRKKKATAGSSIDESEGEAGDKENASSAARTRSRRTRASTKALSDATNDQAEEDPRPTRSSRRLRSKKASGDSAAAPVAATTGRVTRSRSRRQAQVLETIVETTENEDTSPEQSPEAASDGKEEKAITVVVEAEQEVVAAPPAVETPEDTGEDERAEAGAGEAGTQKEPEGGKPLAARQSKSLKPKDGDDFAGDAGEADAVADESQGQTVPIEAVETPCEAGAAKGDKDETLVKPAEKTAQAGKKRARARTKPRQAAHKNAARTQDEEQQQEPVAQKKKARRSAGKNGEVSEVSAETSKEPRRLRRTRRSSRLAEEAEEAARVVVETADPPPAGLSPKELERPVEAAKIGQVGESTPSAIQQTAASNEADDASHIASTPKAAEDSEGRQEEFSGRIKNVEEEALSREVEQKGIKAKEVASQPEDEIAQKEEGVRISDVLETEAAATKKAVQDAKSGGLKNMMSLLSPENDDGPGEPRTLSRVEHASQQREPDQKPSLGLVEKASNVISTVTSFLPSMKKDTVVAKARKPVEVRALKVAEAARKQEALKLEEKMKRKELMRDRAVAAREAKQRMEEQKRRQMIEDQQRKDEQVKRRGEEMARRKREREEEARREREEKRRKMELELEKRKVDEERSQRSLTTGPATAKEARGDSQHGKESGKPHRSAPPNVMAISKAKSAALQSGREGTQGEDRSFAPANRVTGQAGQGHQQQQRPATTNGKPAPLTNRTNKVDDLDAPAKTSVQKPFSFNPGKAPSALVQKTPELKVHQSRVHKTPVAGAHRTKDQGPQSYQMTPYRSDSEESDDECRPAKPVPQWAKSKNLGKQLQAQMSADPDEIFNAKQTTCSLDDVFKTSNPKPCFKRRGSSGNWNEDRVTWKEEWFYKKAMGYVL